MDLTQDEKLIIYLALSTQAEDCHDIIDNNPETELVREAKLVMDKTLSILDKLYDDLNKEEQTISRPQWKR